MTLEFTTDNNLPYWTFFPTFATTAWYHGKSAFHDQSLTIDTVYNNARQFAFNELRNALDMGYLLDQGTYEKTAQTVSDFLGYDKNLVMQNGLKITDSSFFVNVMASNRLVVGRYDSRFTEPAVPSRRGGYSDPSSDLTTYPFTAGINQYLRTELGWTSPSPYNNFGKITEWPTDGADESVIQDMSEALAQNPRLKVLIASGYFDLACPMGTVEYELSQMPGGSALRARVEQTKYFGGHMMYINPTALKQLKSDIVQFVK